MTSSFFSYLASLRSTETSLNYCFCMKLFLIVLTTSYLVSIEDFTILLLLNSCLMFREINSLPLNPTAEFGLILCNLTSNSFCSFLTIV